MVAKWSFDASHALCSDTSRIVPIVKKLHLQGHLNSAYGLFTILEKSFSRTFPPVDALVPLPKPLESDPRARLSKSFRNSQTHL
jgi:hypothetical protein